MSSDLPPTKLWQSGVLLRRYKRFLADVQLADGSEITIHCPNTGSMKNCLLPGSACWFSESDNPKRKYPHTWELASTPGGHWAGINTGRANALVEEAIRNGVIQELQGYDRLLREQRYGSEKSRVDFLLERADEQCFVEVKSVTLMEEAGQGLFPDAVSSRGARHLRELIAMAQNVHRAVLLFCVQHTGIHWVEPADAIDPLYGQTLRMAAEAGVELLAYGASIVPEQGQITLTNALPVSI
ncbi:DNA/RNA nuclease SfsA [Marinimicrobium sp. ABcell2]|uniref:DNA/RNA nuclease SfsA n=1 Tax=Marinimicrobium sp. ABcell2 TaxID=3069751 RepID=UPI0027B57AE7|nr:DNA/RNA nuclease SfsA [Marinimicrobium sp. ABcell2]MDQ2077677.1 DNA/RNA nuclease SfsA [Marinimicrobium sp. ABcell2]